MTRKKISPLLDRKKNISRMTQKRHAKKFLHAQDEPMPTSGAHFFEEQNNYIIIDQLISYLDDTTQECPKNTETAINNLKMIQKILIDHKENNSKLNINEIDPTLNFRFLNRKSPKDIFLKSIKTRLSWRNGEFPVFRINVRYIQLSKTYSNLSRNIYHNPILETSYQVAKDDYIEFPFPEDEWPCKGNVYVTNERLLFKKSNGDQFYIPFSNIKNYQFYKNCVIVKHLQDKSIIEDAFYVDPDNARLLEAVIHVTI